MAPSSTWSDLHPKYEFVIKRLAWMQAPKALIEIMVLLASMDVARPCEHFDVVEMFAGSSRVSRLAKGLGKHAVALDKSIDESMDLNTDAGFLLHCLVLMQAKISQAICVAGHPCSSYVATNKGTSMRTLVTPLGYPGYLSVYRANKCLGRFMLLVLLMVALEIVPVIENPASSLINMHPRFVWTRKALQQCGIPVYRQSFWMKIYNHSNYKRTVCWSTSPALRGLFFAGLPKGAVNNKKVVRRGKKNGKDVWTGTALLKGTECYPPRFASKLLRMQKDFADRRPILPEEVTHHRKHDTLIDFLKRLPDDDWNDAELYSVFDYARCSKLLKMSPQLKELLSLR